MLTVELTDQLMQAKTESCLLLLLEAEWNAGEGEDGGGELGGLRHSKTVGGSLALLLYGLKRKIK
jgi:hypothetical protein